MQARNNKLLKDVSNFFSNHTNDAKSISVGDRFRPTTSEIPIWIVDKVTNVKSSNFPLVSLKREDQPHMIKVLSSNILEDREEFRMV
ncbi:hypothetical protein [Kordiimonas sp. SCSIO 12610]|uniref:hypothetical protein n=1 Tax=Kordiimonas sp. SCSIO 12610 TaxID=2829597 RepID=UPI00210B1702|nr:hypothetical protein [Kordiimonas sp. SCSIO 12610]UTW54093.1 hypothetical protein KFF44_09630 [Kordiimonas sp. SCSIO 12610]